MIVRIDSTEIGYDDIGQGGAVLFLHAFPLDRTMWAPQTSALAAQYRCLTMDTRGFGESTATPPFTMDRYADDAAAVLDAVSVDRAVVVGISMGGYIAFAFWRRHSHRVRALVLSDTRATADGPDARDRRRELMELARTSGAEAVAERQLVGLLGKTTRARRPDIVQVAHGIMARAGVGGIVSVLEALLERPDSTPTLSTIAVPTLLIAGDEDVIAPAKEMRAMHSAVAGSRFEVITGAGHLSNLETPAAFNAILTEFLLSLEGAEARQVRL